MSEPELSESCDLVRRFIEDLFARSNVLDPTSDPDHPEYEEVDWQAIRDAIGDANSLEQAIGRSVVVADLIARGKYPRSSGRSETAVESAPGADKTRSRRDIGTVIAAHKVASPVFMATSVIVIAVVIALVATLGGPPAVALKTSYTQGIKGNAQLLSNEIPNSPTTTSLATSTTTSLPVATTPPAPAPPSLADAPPLRPHEVFGFAPYWALSQSSGFDVNHISTFAYFSIDVNADGTLDESGAGWNGYQSQALADLVTRAHGAGDRVVLTVTDFDQSSLDQLTSSPTASATLSAALISAIHAKNLDGVNLDFEGSGNSDQAGLTSLVTHVSAAIHAANPDYQVTMDTYASAAGDSHGFYNIPALAPAVDAFFVMAYQLNLQSSPSSASPLTSTMFSEKTAVDQYTALVPSTKVILGMPFFGIDWPTSDGTLTAQATGPATNVTYAQVVASGHPIYWDATTDTGWTSYEVGTQWHESFFEVPSSLYDAAQLATANGLGGTGIWALGMDGNDPNVTAALGGLSPAVKSYSAGPTTTSTSSTSTSTSTSDPTSSTTSTSTSSTDRTSSTSTSTSSTEPDSTSSTSTSSSVLSITQQQRRSPTTSSSSTNPNPSTTTSSSSSSP